jgi:hypothetical protein
MAPITPEKKASKTARQQDTVLLVIFISPEVISHQSYKKLVF